MSTWVLHPHLSRGRYAAKFVPHLLLCCAFLLPVVTPSFADYDEYWDGGGGDENWGSGGNWSDDSAPGTGGDAIINMRDNFDGKRNSYYNYGNGDNFKHVKFMSSLGYFMNLNCDTGAGVGLGLYGNIENYSTQGVNFYPKVYFRHTAPLIKSTDSTLYMKSDVWLNDTNTELLFEGANSQSIVMDGAIRKGGDASNCKIKTGSSFTTVVLKNAANDYDGQTTIQYGVLQLDTDEVIPNTSGVWIDSSGVLNKNKKVETVAWIGGSGTVWLGAGGGGGNLTYAGNDSYAFSGVFTDSDAVVKKGTGTWTLSGNSSSFSGNLYAVGGTLRLSNNGAAGTAGTLYLGEQGGSTDAATLAVTTGVSIARAVVVRDQGTGTRTIAAHGSSGTATLSGGVTLNTNATFSADSGGTLEIATTGIGGTKNLTKTGAGTLTFSASNSYGGSTTLSAGTLQLNHASALGGGGNITFGGGTLQFTSNNTADYGSKIKSSGSAIKLDTNGQSVNFTTAIDSSNTGGLGKYGTGTLTLSVANAYTGDTTLYTGGQLKIGHSGALSSGSLKMGGNGTIDNSSGGPLTVANALTMISGSPTFAGSNPLTFNGSVTASGANRTITVSASTLTFAGVLGDEGQVRNLTKAGAGILVLSGAAANTLSGTNIVTAGELHLGKSSGVAVAGDLVVGDSSGTDTVKLLAADQIADTSAVTVNSVGVLDLNGYSEAVDALTGAAGAIIDSTSGSPTFTVGSNGSGGTFEGVITNTAGALALTKNGAGTLVLSGTVANAHTGLTTVNGGALHLGKSAGVDALAGDLTIGDGSGTDTVQLLAANQIADTSAVTLNSTGVLDLNGNSETVDGLSGSAGAVVDGTSGTPTLTVGSDGGGGTYAGVIQNSGGTLALTKTGAGTLTLSGANTYSGNTTISNGTLKLAGSTGNVIPNGTGKGNVVLNPGFGDTAVFDLNGRSSETINGLSSSGAGTSIVDNGSGSASTPYTLTVGANDQTSTFDGTIQNTSGSLEILKTGTGALTLNGASTHTGGTRIDGGRLNIGNAAALGVGVFGFSGNAEFDNTAGGSLDVDNDVLLRGGSPTFVGTDDLTLTGTVTMTNANRSIDVDAGTLTLSGAVLEDGTSRSLTKAGPGTLVLAGTDASGYTGATVVDGGTLVLNKTGVQAVPASVLVGDNFGTDTLRLQASDQIADTGDLTLAANGVFDLNGNSEAIDALTGAAGAVIDGTAGTPLLTVGADGGGGTFAGAIQNTAGTLALTKSGAGTLVLSGANTYGGATTVAGGVLQVNGSVGGPGGTVTVNSGATLAGTGSVARDVAVEASGTLAPGSGGVGTLTVGGAVTLASGSTFTCKVNSSAAGAYGQLKVTTGNVDLGSATLDLSATAYTASNGDLLWIVDNTGGGSTSGAFNGVADNGVVTTGDGKTFFIRYGANHATGALSGGNDVVLVSVTAGDGSLFEVE